MKLICTDLDRTLLPNGEQAESFPARPILWHLLKTHDIKLAYVSGRDLRRVLDAIDQYGLPVPDIIVSDVGASIYMPIEDNWVKNAAWDARIANDWGGAFASDIKVLLKQFDYLQDQEEDRQSTHKLSYYYSATADESILRESIDTVFAAHGVKAALVFSHDPEKGVGLLDVLPLSTTKRQAVEFLQSLFALPAEQIMFAGDSGNDVSAICAINPGVLVANADAATRQSVVAAMNAALEKSVVYFAVGNLAVAGLGKLNGNYAAGIVEGLLHYRPEWAACLADAQWLEQAIENTRN